MKERLLHDVVHIPVAARCLCGLSMRFSPLVALSCPPGLFSAAELSDLAELFRPGAFLKILYLLRRSHKGDIPELPCCAV